MLLNTNLSIKRSLCAALTSSLRQQQLDSALQMMVQSFGADAGAIYLLNAAGQLVLAAHHGFSAAFAAKVSVIDPGMYLVGTWENAKPMFRSDIPDNDRHFHPDLMAVECVRAAATSPLRYSGLTFGIAIAGWRRPFGNPLSPDDLQVFEILGNVLGTAATAAQLYKLEQQQPPGQSALTEKCRCFFEETIEAVLVCDFLRQMVVEANQAAVRLTGYTRRELEGLPLGQLWPEASLRTIADLNRKWVEGKFVTHPVEVPLLTRDGKSSIVQVTGRVIVRPDRTALTQLTLHDLTEQKQAQEVMTFYISHVIRAQEAERKRLAWQLHEETIQSLLQVSRQLQDLASGKRGRLTPEARQALEDAAEVLSGASQQVRQFCHDLRPMVLDDLGLVAALKWLVRSLTAKGGAAIALEVEGTEQRLVADSELALFRIAQEALNNVRRHAGATKVTLTLSFRDDRVSLRIADDGRGFEAPRHVLDLAKDGKIGLLSIHERAQLVGGTLDIRSQPGHGTELLVEVPARTPARSGV